MTKRATKYARILAALQRLTEERRVAKFGVYKFTSSSMPYICVDGCEPYVGPTAADALLAWAAEKEAKG